VHNIEEDCQIVPIGAIKILPTHELIKNQGFRGLKIKLSALQKATHPLENPNNL
jgi:hypothetical protein